MIEQVEQVPVSSVVPQIFASGSIVGAIVGILPQIIGVVAAVVAMCYYTICIWESRTIQHWNNNRKLIRKAKRVARLKAEQKVLFAELEALEMVREAKAIATEKVETAKVEAAKLVAAETTKASIDPHNIAPR